MFMTVVFMTGYPTVNVDDDGFIDRLNQYVYDNHYDDKIDDIAKDWQLPRYELVKKVLNELNKK